MQHQSRVSEERARREREGKKKDRQKCERGRGVLGAGAGPLFESEAFGGEAPAADMIRTAGQAGDQNVQKQVQGRMSHKRQRARQGTGKNEAGTQRMWSLNHKVDEKPTKRPTSPIARANEHASDLCE